MSFAVGSLVRARGREWVVQPETEGELLVLRPLGGAEDEVAGIWTPLEKVEPAQFDLPDPELVGDHRSCRLLRDAVRLGFRSSAGPFRSFGSIAVEPRPYQLVPLLMALKQDPVRLLIADDVGIGKTVEACLVARELLDRGDVQHLAVLCPPHLAEQWRNELERKFHIEAELVLASTAARLERRCRVGQSLFELYPHVIVSMDFIKSETRREEFVRSCPELVIVDEAHTCSVANEANARAHQRHVLVRRLAEDTRVRRHMVLVTATPDSGQEDALPSLLGLLDPKFFDLPQDLTGQQHAQLRRRIAQQFVQRRRADIRHFLDADTPFPERESADATYELGPAYAKLFERVLAYARESVRTADGSRYRQRVRWWSAIALLRSLASSPAAAAATLRTRAAPAAAADEREADEVGRAVVLDVDATDVALTNDVVPGSDPDGSAAGDEPAPAGADDASDAAAARRRLRDLARAAEKLFGDEDRKLVKGVALVKDLLKDGHHPIVFCRFIPTADYVARELRERLPKGVEVQAVTGTLPPAEREERVLALAQHPKRVLVCTDCLSEGINLQEHFDAVLHYDLAWNPTRHEQREGRVDRYGQPRKTVRVVTYYGTDNQIDGIVLDVLLRKHATIRSRLGVSVPVPSGTNAVVEAIFEGMLLREQASGGRTGYLPGFEEHLRPKREDLYERWEKAADREKRSRTMFAQESIKVEEVARELAAARAAIGSGTDVARFFRDALEAGGATVTERNGTLNVDVREARRVLRELIADRAGGKHEIAARFELPVEGGELHLTRTHPLIESLGSFVSETALDPAQDAVARRAGAIRTRAVAKRTTLLLVRFRFDVVTRRGEVERTLLAEECDLLAFTGAPDAADWLDRDAAEALLDAAPAGNVLPEQATSFVRRVVDGFAALRPAIDDRARERAAALLETHRRVREESKARGATHRVEPQLPADVLGVYVLLPASAAS
ncbi:MAG: helicase-related protein [Thermodesulfobacteriota bacterium]